MRRGEIAAAVVAVLLVLAGLVLNAAVPSHHPAAARIPAAATPLSTAWYCPVPTTQNLGSTAWTANLGSGALHLRATGFGTGSGAATTEDLASGLATNQVAPSPAPAPAVVEGFGQSNASFLTVVGSTTGGTAAPCSSQPGRHWLFATASTAPGYDTYIYVANPFPEQAGVTVRVLSPNGDLVPAGLDNFPIPPSSQTTIYLADYYPETPSFGLDITATRGRLVVDRLMRVNTAAARGLNMSLGVTAPQLQWIFPGGQTPAQGEEDLVVANPSNHEALVNESFQTVDGSAPAGQQNVSVPAGSQVTLKLSDEVPAGTQHSTILSVSNGVPVVADRVTIDGGSAKGYESVQGATGAGTSWWVPAGAPTGGTDILGVVNTSAVTATVGVSVVTASATSNPPDLASLQVAGGLRATFDLTPYLNGQPAVLLVRASSGQIAVENDVQLPSTYRNTIESVGLPGG
ncbi:MAG TPA: DUF5719 family protein [Actinomycetota bacterium]|nr:DUF5719 family protein [Actinomycetota bacterium]